MLGERFRDWGIPTAAALASSARTRLPLIATGGVRSGLDAAKALALGATVVGVGRPLLKRALEGESAVHEWIAQFELELRTAVFLSGRRRARDLPSVTTVVTGATAAWFAALGVRPPSGSRSRSYPSR